jgi:CBS domain-containing protein
MVGMAAVLAGSARAPLTAILLLFELTRDYRIVLPLMAAVGLSVWLVERFKPASPQPSNLEKLGLNLEKNPDPEVLKRITVAEAMERSPLKLLNTLSILEAGKILVSSRVHTGLVIDQADSLMGIVTLNDIGRAIATIEENTSISTAPNSLAEMQVNSICTQAVLCTYEDETLAEASARMATRGLHQLPVVAHENPQQVLGLLTKESIDLASSTSATRAALQHYCSKPASTEPFSVVVSFKQLA